MQQLQSAVDDISLCCRDNHLTLNISETKEMLIDFRHSSTSPPALQLDGQITERLEEYTCLGSITDLKLTVKSNA